MQLDSEMPMIERRIAPPVPSVNQREGNVVAEEIDPSDLPLTCSAHHRKQALTSGYEQCVAHRQPPDSA
jgi:hypothetical protein